MKSIKFTAVALLCFLVWASPVLATVTLKVPKTVKVLAVNGEEVEDKDKRSVLMPNGVNQVVFRIDTELPGKSLLDGTRVASDVLIAKFSATNQGLTMQVPEIKKQYQMDKFNSEPDVKLMTAQGENFPLVLDKLIKEGFQLMRDYEDEIADYNKTDGPAAVWLEETSVAAAPAAQAKLSRQSAPLDTSVPAGAAGDQAMAEKMLKYWYQQADDETRQRFWEWITE